MEPERRSISDWIALASPGVLIVVGVVLFVVPLPPTSMIGMGLIILGTLFWVAEFLGSRRERLTEAEEPDIAD